MHRWRRNALRLAIGSALTIAFLFLFLRQVDLGEAWKEIKRLPGWSVLAALALIVVNVAFMTARWKVLLGRTAERVTYRQHAASVCVGRGANNVLPARGGDLLRIESMREAGHVPAFVSVGGLFAERLLDGVVLAAWIVLGAVLIGQGGPMLYTGIALCVGAIGGVTLVALAAKHPNAAETVVWRLARRLPPKWHRKVIRAAANVVEGLGAFSTRRRLILVLTTSLGMWIADVAMYAIVGEAYGLDLGIGAYFLLEGIGNLALAVPATAAGLGTFDYLTLQSAKAIDVPETQATAYVLTMHAFTVVPVTIAGLFMVRTAFPTFFGRRRATEPVDQTS
jgi:uncharacterized protein (TIRG00374 family)